MRTLKSIKYLITAPFIFAMLFVVNWMTTPGQWWIKWVALGMGIAWVIALLRVVRMIVLLGGLAAFGMWLANRQKGSDPIS
jgi:hypothetical protein